MICNHNIEEKNNSLVKINKKNMVFPHEEFFYCKNCKKGFIFVKNEQGKYIMKK